MTKNANIKEDENLLKVMAVEHEIRLRVRYEETDTMRVVHYSKYFIWFEAGRVELLRSVGILFKDFEKNGFLFPVVEAVANYKSPARFDDEILLRTKVAKIGNSSIRFENQALKLPDETLICEGHTVHVLTDANGQPTQIPRAVASKLMFRQ